MLKRAFAPVAQLDRVIDYESIGREFEPRRVHHWKHRVPAVMRIGTLLHLTVKEQNGYCLATKAIKISG